METRRGGNAGRVCQRNDRVYVRHAGSDVLSYNITRFFISFGRAGNQCEQASKRREVRAAHGGRARVSMLRRAHRWCSDSEKNSWVSSCFRTTAQGAKSATRQRTREVGQRGVSVVNGSMNVSITGWSDKCLNVHQLRGARASMWWRGQRERCGVSGSRMDVDGSLRMRCRKEIPSCFLITCVRAAATGGDKGADLGPLYLCSVTDVRRSSLHSVLRPGSAWQQISAGCSPRHPTVGGCVARARRR